MNETQDKAVIIYSTFPTKSEASKTGKVLVSEKLAACINIFERVHSIYAWEGEVREENEVGAYIKTISSKADALINRLKEIHSYDVPAIMVIEPQHVDAEYAKWLEKQVL